MSPAKSSFSFWPEGRLWRGIDPDLLHLHDAALVKWAKGLRATRALGVGSVGWVVGV